MLIKIAALCCFHLYSFFRVFELILMISMGTFDGFVWVVLSLGSIKGLYDDFGGGDQRTANTGNFLRYTKGFIHGIQMN